MQSRTKGGELPGLKRLAQSARQGRLEVVAGVLGGATNAETGKPIALYAKVMEYGSATVPARPFMRETVAEHEREWKEQLAQGIKARGLANAKPVLGVVGRLMVADIVETIRKGKFKSLKPRTIARKRFKGRPEPELPLVDTTSMIKAIASEVRNK